MTDFSPEAVDTAIKEKKMTKRNVAVPAPMPANDLSSMLLSAAHDTNVDADKLDKLYELYRKTEHDKDRREFQHHMSLLQGEISHIAADAANPQTSSRYASYAALDAALRPHYTKHGFSVSHTQEDHPAGTGWVRMTCVVSRGLYETRHHSDVQIDQLGPKGNKVMTGTHAGASAQQYGKRYSLAMAFNLVVAKDDDGNKAGARSLTRTQVDELETLAHECGVDVEAFFPVASEHLGYEIKSFAEIHRADFGRVRSSILARRKKEQQG